MGINIYEAKNQASRATGYANDLRAARRDLQQYQSNLRQLWKADEMVPINRAIEALLQKMNAASSELDSLGSDISAAADAVKRSEDLSAAQTELRYAQDDMDTAKRNFESALNFYNDNPSAMTEIALSQAQDTYNTAITKYDNTAAKVRSLS